MGRLEVSLTEDSGAKNNGGLAGPPKGKHMRKRCKSITIPPPLFFFCRAVLLDNFGFTLQSLRGQVNDRVLSEELRQGASALRDLATDLFRVASVLTSSQQESVRRPDAQSSKLQFGRPNE